MSSKQLTTVDAVKRQLSALTPELITTLPPGVKPERFVNVAMTAVQQNPKLLECAPDSLFNACKKAALDGLLPDGREGAIVPRWNNQTRRLEASWQPMVAGIQAKAKRRGNVVSLAANVVYEGEEFDTLLGDDERIVHRRDLSKVRRGKEVAVYAIATLKDGTKEREVMTWEQVQDVRKSSGTPDAGPWAMWTDEMARKSVIRRLSKRLPSLDDGDDELRAAVERVDELYPFGRKAPEPAPAAQTIEGEVAEEMDDGPGAMAETAPLIDRVAEGVRTLIERINGATGETLQAITSDTQVVTQRKWLADKRPDLAGQVDDAVKARLAELDADAPKAMET